MGTTTCSKHEGVVAFIVLWQVFCAVAQPGFLSIDCGGKTNSTDPKTNITWVTDDDYVQDRSLTAYINDYNLPFYLQTRRVFPKPIKKSCYQLSITPNVPHLLRIWFVGDNYNLSGLPNFKYSIETLELLSLRDITDQTIPPSPSEKILVSSGKSLYVCLIRTSTDTDPFISAIELRILRQGMYNPVKPGTMLDSMYRHDLGGAKSIVRYPQDCFDRLWSPLTISNSESVSLPEPISTNNTRNLPPTAVMQTALVSDGEMTIDLAIPIESKFLLLLYFAELEQLNVSKSRFFSISINNDDSLKDVRLVRNFSAVELAFFPGSILAFSISKSSQSSRGPILNAFEVYELVATASTTSTSDVQALAAVKQIFNLRNWISDPCFAIPWQGIICDNNSLIMRVSEINLAERNLKGHIPPALSQLTAMVNLSLDNNYLTGSLPDLSTLTKLEKLNLHNNNLCGEVPDWLGQLPNLKELSIQNNNFSGIIPKRVLDMPSLKIKYDGNYYLCMNKGECMPSSNSTFSRSKGHLVGVLVGTILSGTVVVALAFFAGIVIRRKKKLRRNSNGGFPDYSVLLIPNPSKSRAFTVDEMVRATENFGHKIGQGGFGSVFLGTLPGGTRIAVKTLSFFSKQGAAQFLNEVDLLSRVHHKNLVSLLGYCNASRGLMLIYEYMPGGSLSDRLYGRNASESHKLEWKTRLKVALNAAQGLEYLHVGCVPKIIHRDVKSANLLLDINSNAKLADFGLSRVAIDDETSHISTAVRGTAGYLDPKYFSTRMLTEKSDVYSFGEVLLEIICGRKTIDIRLSEEEADLIKWVTPYLKQVEDPDKLKGMVDKRLDNKYNVKSVSCVAELAMKCISDEPSCRPRVSEIVVDIKEAIKYEAENYSPQVEVLEEAST